MTVENDILNVPKHGNKHDLIHFVTQSFVEWGRKFSEIWTLPSELYCLTGSQTQQVAKQYNTFITCNGKK